MRDVCDDSRPARRGQRDVALLRAEDVLRSNGRLMSAFDAIKAVRYGPEWSDGHVSAPQTNILRDVAKNRLPGVSWVVPDQPDSDHPGESVDDGPPWVATIVNAIGESAYWKSTAIIIVWDDWGGLYDNLEPPQPVRRPRLPRPRPDRFGIRQAGLYFEHAI